MEIARAKDGEVQQALAQAYEQKTIPGDKVLAIRHIIEQRNNSGKGMHQHDRRRTRSEKPVTSETLIRMYQRETERQGQLVKRAKLAQNRVMFVSTALRKLLADDHFQTLLRAEGLHTLPRPLAERIGLERL
jgi:ParB family chromosome partitioning protein